MKARLRVISAAVALAAGLAVPALAQEAQTTGVQAITPEPTASSGEAVGPAQLRDFSLQGTVTRSAETPSQPEPRSQPTRDASPVPAQARSAPTPEVESSARVATRAETPTGHAAAAAPSNAPDTAGLPTPAQTLSFSPATMIPQAPAITEPMPVGDASPALGSGYTSYWPWLLALLAAIGAVAWYFRRQRSGYAYAGAEALDFDLSPPPPAPASPRLQTRPLPPQPAPPPSAPPMPLREEPVLTGAVVSTRLKVAPQVAPETRLAPAPAPSLPGIVSTRLRPWLDIEFVPLAASFNDQHGVIEFDVTLFNSGSAPARDILLEARLFNAGDDQDQVISKFFENPAVDGERIDVLQPLKRLAFRTSAKVPRDQMRVFEAGGRKVWVPLIGFNSCYRWGGGDGQTSASYLLGRNAAGGKMAPFRVDLGSRTFNGLDTREHTMRVRR